MQFHLDLDVLAERASQQVPHAGDQAIEVDRLRHQRLLARERQQLANEAGTALCRLQRALDRRLEVALHPADGEIEAPDHDREQVVEVVRDPAGESPDSFDLLRLPQLLFRLPPLRDVLDGSGRVMDSPGFVIAVLAEAEDRANGPVWPDDSALDTEGALALPYAVLEVRLRPGAVLRPHDAVVELGIGNGEVAGTAAKNGRAFRRVVGAADDRARAVGVPDPIADPGDLLGLPEAGFAVLQGGFGLLALGDVEIDAAHAFGPAVGRAIDAAAAQDPSGPAIRVNDAKLDFVTARPALEESTKALRHVGAIVRVNASVPLFGRGVALLGRQAIEAIVFRGTDDPALGQVPLVAPGVGPGQSQLEPLAALPQRRFRAPALSDDYRQAQCAQTRREHEGLCRQHALVQRVVRVGEASPAFDRVPDGDKRDKE